MSSPNIIILRVDRDGDVFRVVLHDSGKVLCSGPREKVMRWLDENKKQNKTLAEYLAASDADAQAELQPPT